MHSIRTALATITATGTAAVLLSVVPAAAASPVGAAGSAEQAAAAQAPGRPQRVTVFGGDDASTVRLGWLTPARSGSKPIRTYVVKWRGGRLVVKAPTTQVAITGLAPGTYAFRVRAVSRAGAGPWSRPTPPALVQ